MNRLVEDWNGRLKSSNLLHQLNPNLHDFDAEQFGSIKDLKALKPTADGWSAIMVTCSEFGFQPDQTSIFEIGRLYIIQNFGNVILPLGDSEFQTEVTHALQTKGLRDVIVCGHVNCRTVGHFLLRDRDNDWLQHGDRLREFMESRYSDLDESAKVNIAAQENVLLQLEKELESLRQANVNARIHGWMIGVSANRVYRFDPNQGQFIR